MKSSEREISCLWSEKHNCAILQITTGDVRLVIFDPEYSLAIHEGMACLSLVMVSWCSLTTVTVSWIISVGILQIMGKTHHITFPQRERLTKAGEHDTWDTCDSGSCDGLFVINIDYWILRNPGIRVSIVLTLSLLVLPSWTFFDSFQVIAFKTFSQSVVLDSRLQLRLIMSCVESLLADLEQLMGTAGQGLSDIVILCEAEEIKVHRLILGAR